MCAYNFFVGTALLAQAYDILAPEMRQNFVGDMQRSLKCVCVVVCCSVLLCVAVCCSVLQCVVECCSVLQCVAVSCYVFAVCCSVLQCGGVLQCVVGVVV